MSKKTNILIVVGAAIVVAVLAFMTTLVKPNMNPSPSLSPSLSISPGVSVSPTPSFGIPDLIFLDQPAPNQIVTSPIIITGRARGTWFFEANFPIRILDANGKELAVVVAQADGDWMTMDFVGFHAVLNFKKPTTTKGTLVLQKDNPSGLPEHDQELRVPLYFDLENWPPEPSASGGCKVGGCSGQLCLEGSAEDMVTTCEWREEYACYQKAKCERQNNGQCGWTQSADLTSCLSRTQGTRGI